MREKTKKKQMQKSEKMKKSINNQLNKREKSIEVYD